MARHQHRPPRPDSRPPRRVGTIANPATGERIEFRDGPTESLRFDYRLAPGGFAVGRLDHGHPHQEERFDIRSGQLGVRVDGDEWTATPGTRFAVLPGTPHTVWNDGATELHAVVELRPALAIDAFFETLYGLAGDGKTLAWGLPGPLQLAVLADEFSDEVYFAGLPGPLYRGAIGALAPIGRLAGYRARYPRYSPRLDSRP